MKKALRIIIAISLLLVLTGCSKNHDNNEAGYVKKEVNIVSTWNYTGIVIQVMMLNDLLTPFLPDDVTVNWIFMDSSADQRDSLVAGRIDIVALAVLTVISAIENDLPLRVLANQGLANAKVLSTKDNINSIYDLTVNSRITIQAKGTTPYLSFALRCKDIFGNPMIFDNGLAPVPNADVMGLIATSRDYDAFILPFPLYTKIPNGVNYHLIDDLAQTALKYNVGTYFVTSEMFQKNNPVLTEAFLKAAGQAVDILINNTDEAARLLAEFYEVDAKTIEEVIREAPPSLEVSKYDDIANAMFEMGVLIKPPKKFSELPNYNDIPTK